MLHKLLDCISRAKMLLCLCSIFVWTMCNCVFIELNARLITSIVNGDNIKVLAIQYILLIGFWCAMEYLLDVVSDALFYHIENVTYQQGFDNTYRTKPEVLKRANAGYITGIMRTLTSKRSDLLMYTLSEGVMAIFYTGYFTVRLSSFHCVFSFVLIALVVTGTFIRIYGKRLMMPVTDKLVEADGIVTKTFIDIVTNINTAQKMQASKFLRGRLDNALNTYYRSGVKNTEANDIFYCMFKFIIYMYSPICLFITAIHDFGFSAVEFYAIVSPLSIQLVHMVKCIANFFKRLDLYTSAQEKVDAVINEDTVDRSCFVDVFDDIDIRGADYTYQHNVTKSMVHIQVPFMRVSAGDKICVYGESGQGKTTTLNILSRQIETDNVYIDSEQTINKINCVFISQDTEIFDMSVRDNLTLGNSSITDSELLYMLDSVGLSDWINSQKCGLDTMLGEHGVFVSTGQRQRLNLIRGLLIQDKYLYLLDEPTSNVDEFTERRMVSLISERLKDKTFVIVSHRKAIAEICNKFYKFENGICGEATSVFNV